MLELLTLYSLGYNPFSPLEMFPGFPVLPIDLLLLVRGDGEWIDTTRPELKMGRWAGGPHCHSNQKSV